MQSASRRAHPAKASLIDVGLVSSPTSAYIRNQELYHTNKQKEKYQRKYKIFHNAFGPDQKKNNQSQKVRNRFLQILHCPSQTPMQRSYHFLFGLVLVRVGGSQSKQPKRNRPKGRKQQLYRKIINFNGQGHLLH